MDHNRGMTHHPHAMPPPKTRRLKGPIILMAIPAAVTVLLAVVYAVLLATPLGTDPNAAGIFLPLALLVGAALVVGGPVFLGGLIWLFVRLGRRDASAGMRG